MAPVKKPKRQRQRHFFRAWREYAKLRQEDAAAKIKVDQSTLSKIENGKSPYNQDLLEQLAPLYNAREPADLIRRDPRLPFREDDAERRNPLIEEFAAAILDFAGVDSVAATDEELLSAVLKALRRRKAGLEPQDRPLIKSSTRPIAPTGSRKYPRPRRP